MSKHDMSGVNPLRWAEVRRRIATVQSYLLLPDPTDQDRAEHAKSIGVSANQFIALVRSWRGNPRLVRSPDPAASAASPAPEAPAL